MLYAIVSDIHANALAWRTVALDIRDVRADKIICLGDVLGYGPDPVATLEAIHAQVDICLMGNHDAAVADIVSTLDFTPVAADAVARHRQALSKDALEWIKSLQYVYATENFACTHGDFLNPKAFRYIIEAEDALPSWRMRKEELLFVGHSHEPGIFVIGASGEPHHIEPCDFQLEPGKRYIVNPGSVGYPRAGNGRMTYCLYDTETKIVKFHQFPFDIEAFQTALHKQGLPEIPWVAARAKASPARVVRDARRFGASIHLSMPRSWLRVLQWGGASVALLAICVTALLFVHTPDAMAVGVEERLTETLTHIRSASPDDQDVKLTTQDGEPVVVVKHRGRRQVVFVTARLSLGNAKDRHVQVQGKKVHGADDAEMMYMVQFFKQTGERIKHRKKWSFQTKKETSRTVDVPNTAAYAELRMTCDCDGEVIFTPPKMIEYDKAREDS